MKKYDETIMKLSQLNDKQRLIVALLDLERMWAPFIIGTSYYIWDIRTMVRRWLDILWQEVLEGQMTDSEKSELEQIADEINETQNQGPELVAEKNSGVLYEISSIETDVELAKRYPESIDEILKKKEEYHKENILDIIFLDE